MKLLEEKLGYTFEDKNLLKIALTHSSYVKEENIDRSLCNERLEFLGDSVLGAVISQCLYDNLSQNREGSMAKMKSDIVRAETLADLASNLSLGSYLFLSNGEKTHGGSCKMNILADAMEAILGAVFIESGYDEARRVILNLFADKIDMAHKGKLNSDYKSRLQELVHRLGGEIKYVLENEEGLSHDKTFYTAVEIDNKVMGRGSGKNKKSSENEAAREALNKLEHDK